MSTTDKSLDEELMYLRKKIFEGLDIPEGTLLARPASDMLELTRMEDTAWLERSLRKILSERMFLRVKLMLRQYTLMRETDKEYKRLNVMEEGAALSDQIVAGMGIPREYLEPSLSRISNALVELGAKVSTKDLVRLGTSRADLATRGITIVEVPGCAYPVLLSKKGIDPIPITKYWDVSKGCGMETIEKKVHAIASEMNAVELRAEEADCVESYLNDRGAPTEEDGEKLSLVGRIGGLVSETIREVPLPLPNCKVTIGIGIDKAVGHCGECFFYKLHEDGDQECDLMEPIDKTDEKGRQYFVGYQLENDTSSSVSSKCPLKEKSIHIRLKEETW